MADYEKAHKLSVRWSRAGPDVGPLLNVAESRFNVKLRSRFWRRDARDIT